MSWRFSRRAERDVRQIAERIAADNPAAAGRWLERLDHLLAKAAFMPGMGAPRDEVRPALRFVTHGDYLVLYTPERDHIVVVRVVHGARRWQSLV
ncbi:MAG: type II toxin-antitoxin system RelE/ParE family toxin [Acetobacteraceae bacterium]|nr:type II toxin-antitoxin system RelE/ParE family toxin [Acetobacteraceae bacterium]